MSHLSQTATATATATAMATTKLEQIDIVWRAHGQGLSARFARAMGALRVGAPPRAAPAPVIEFHADAEAGAGALYADGELVGWLPGVNRL